MKQRTELSSSSVQPSTTALTLRSTNTGTGKAAPKTSGGPLDTWLKLLLFTIISLLQWKFLKPSQAAGSVP